MIPILDVPAIPLSAAAGALPSIELQGYTFAERRVVVALLTDVMTSCGCWLLERRGLSLSAVEFRFEVGMRAALDLYASLVGADVELTRESHMALTTLCTLRRHNPCLAMPGRVVTVRLEVSFLEDDDLAEPMPTPGNA